MGNIDIGDASGIDEGLGLFQITPATPDRSGVRLAGDPPEGLGIPSEQPPEIPKEEPKTSMERTMFFRAARRIGWCDTAALQAKRSSA